MKRLMLILTMTVIGFVVSVNSSANTIVTDKLVSYWSFDLTTITDNIVEDIWGENDATIMGNPTVTDGHIEQGLELDGNGDYVRIPNVGNFGSKIGAYTFEAWFKTTYKEKMSAIFKVEEPPCVGVKSGFGVIINAWWDPRTDKFETKEDMIAINDSVIKKRTTCIHKITVIHRPVSDGKWHHIVFTSRKPTEEEVKEIKRNFGKTLEGNCIKANLYIDKVSVYDSISCSFPILTHPYLEPTYLGAVNNRGNTSNFFKGVFDEVRMYDRALEHDEVFQNYHSRIGYSVDLIQRLPTVWGALKARR